MAISTNGAIITRLAGALYNEYLSNASYLEVSTTAPATVAANWLSNDFAGKTDAELATTILTNLGLTSITGLDNWVAAQLTAAGSTAAAKGAALVSMLNGYAGMTADATYGTYATSFNAKVAASLTASQTDGAAGGAFGTSDAVVVTDATIALTSSLDYLVGADGGGAGDDSFLALTSGQLATGDVITGGAGTDTLSSRHTITDALTIAPDLNSVEVVKVRLDADGAAADVVTYSLTDAVGVTEVQSYRSVNSVVTGGSHDPVLTFSGTGMTTAVTLAIVGGDTGADNNSVDITATYASVTGAADSSNLRLDGAAANVVTIAGIETLNITSTTGDRSASATGGSTIKTLTAENAKTVNINAAGTTTFSATNLAEIVTINASASTGSVRVATESSSKVTFTGGAGGDKVTIGAISQLTVDDQLDGGAGTDVLVTSSASLDSTALAAIARDTVNFERLEITATTSVTVDMTDLAVWDSLSLTGATIATAGTGTSAESAGNAGDNAHTITGIDANDSLIISGAVTGGDGEILTAHTAEVDGGDGGDALVLTPELDNGNNSYTITFSANIAGGAGGGYSGTTAVSSGSAGDGGDGIDASAFETLTLITTQNSAGDLTSLSIAGGATGSVVAGGIAGNAGKSVVIGTNGKIIVQGAIDLNLGTIAGTNATVDAAAFTGDLTVVGEAGANSFIGGSGDDVFTGQKGLDTYTTGSGTDRIVIGIDTTTTASDAPANGTSFESISDFSSTDLLDFLATNDAALSETIVTNASSSTGIAAINAEGVATFATADDTLAERITAVEAAIQVGSATAGQFAVFEFSGSTYVFVSNGSDTVQAGDVVVKLVGLTGISNTTIDSSGYLSLS